jgi:alpha-glucosidase (family GH31 glycosyl hydrolase)
LPLVRPLYLEYPDDDRAYANPQEYLYGDSFLVAPIVSRGKGRGHVASQKVWLPAGMWYGLFDGSKHEGPAESEFSADLSSFPVFARGGVPIPMQPYTPRMGTDPLKTLIVRAYPGEDGKKGSFTLYEDDGVSDEYEKGSFALTGLEYLRDGKEISVSILPAKGAYRGQLASRKLIVELPSAGDVVSAEADGKPVADVFDRAAGMHVFDLGEWDIRAAAKLRVLTR